MASTKLTKKDYFNMMSEIVANSDDSRADELQGFIAHELELLNRKSSSKRPTKTQAENEIIIGYIGEALRNVGEPVTVTDLIASDTRLKDYTNQKISALIGKVEGVIREVNKKKAYYSLKQE